MSIEHHDLHHEFPELSEQIHSLKMSDRHFAKLFDEYHELDKEVRHLEDNNSPTTDEHLESLKLRRVQLKDELYTMLTQVAEA